MLNNVSRKFAELSRKPGVKPAVTNYSQPSVKTMKLLAIYLVLAILFLFGVNAFPAEYEHHAAPVPDWEFREVEQDGTVTDVRMITAFTVYRPDMPNMDGLAGYGQAATQ